MGHERIKAFRFIIDGLHAQATFLVQIFDFLLDEGAFVRLDRFWEVLPDAMPGNDQIIVFHDDIFERASEKGKGKTTFLKSVRASGIKDGRRNGN